MKNLDLRWWIHVNTDKYALSQLAEYKLATVKKCIELMSGGGVFPIAKKLEAGEDGKSVQDAVVIFTDENDKVLPFERWRDSRKLNRLLAFWVLNLFLIYDMYSSVSDFWFGCLNFVLDAACAHI